MPKFEKILIEDDESFFIGIFQDNLEKSTWHYHNNYELSFIIEGTGKRIVADSIEDFQPGDLVFLGQNLPHAWIADKEIKTLSNRTLEMVFMQFTEKIVTPQMLILPEYKNVAKAIKFSERGIQITGDTLNEVSELMLQMPYLKGFERMIHFLRIMDCIGRSNAVNFLASKEYMRTKFNSGDKRIALIHEYMMKNYREEIDLGKIAALVNMAEGSLCRYFKRNMGITIFEYLNKLKIEFACKLLMNIDLNIPDVCFKSGFNNISHFNKQFRKFTSTTPLQYRKRYFDLD